MVSQVYKYPSVRRVFGRLLVVSDGEQFKVELTKDGLTVRKKHSRKRVLISLGELVNHARNEPLLFPPMGKVKGKQ